MVQRMEKHILTMVDHGLKLFICLLVLTSTRVMSTPSSQVDITYLESAVAKGAVCLDGSPPAYWYSKGYGEGVNNWLIYLQGGGWCGTSKDCGYRLRDETGSSKYKKTNIYFGQLRSVNQTENPDFYNWNRVYVAYCDSSSYMGDVEAADPINNITRRGKRIFDAIVEDLITKGMANAENVLLSGGSAGGLAVILHCDGFRELLPNASRVKCFGDSAFFIHAKHLPGAKFRENLFAKVVEYHGITKSLPSSCTSKMNASLCIFPEFIVKDIKTPLFLLESAFDHYQLQDHHFSNESTWRNCTDNLDICTPSQLQTMKDYGFALRETMQHIRDCSNSIGMFVHSCFRHGHMYEKSGWDVSTKLGDKTIAQAVGDWYFDRDSKPFQEIDTNNELPRRHDCSQLTVPDPSLHTSTNL